MAGAPANWYVDPTGRFEVRYWDGARWTEHVHANGVRSSDPLAPSSQRSQRSRSGPTGGAVSRSRDDELKELKRALRAIDGEVKRQRRIADGYPAQREQAKAAIAALGGKRRALLGQPSPFTQPVPQPYGVSAQGAELLVRDWMRFFGVLDAEVTQYAGDGGVDVTSLRVVAQVKHYAGSVPVAAVRELFGVATALGKHAAMFTSGRLTVDGLAFASSTGMAALHYDAAAGSIDGLNTLGTAAIEYGFPAAFKYSDTRP